MIKKVKLFVMAIAVLVVLTSCQSVDLDFSDFDFSFDKITSLFSSNDSENAGESHHEVDNNSNGTGEENGGSDSDFEKIANDDIAQIFENMAKAIKPVKSVSSVAEIKSEDDDGDSTHTITRIKTILDPLVVHIEFEGEAQVMEMYADEKEVFANVPGQGWVISPDYGGHLKHVGQQINEDHILHFNNYLEHFDATSDDTHYIITYIGPDEMFDEIFMNENLLEEVFGDLYGVLEGLGDLFEMSNTGEVTMKVWKDSFLMDEQIMTVESETTILGFGMKSTDHTVQKLTYDEVEPFSIPDEVRQSAKNLD